MPIEVKAYAAAAGYANPLLGPVDHVAHIKVDLSILTINEVDADGYLKPGVLLTLAGILVGIAPAFPFGVVFEATKLALVTIPPTNATLATETGDHFVAVCTHGIVNRDVAEDNMGRAYTADEIASFDRAGSNLKLTST
jgi:hypothetical protein